MKKRAIGLGGGFFNASDPEAIKEWYAREREFMFNYRDDALEQLRGIREEGITTVGEIQEYPYGKFAWIMDPEGNKIELWEPVDETTL